METDEVDEAPTGQAGWMFADMLIALTVIFLASIGFINQFSIEANLQPVPVASAPADPDEEESEEIPLEGVGSRECQYRDTYRFQLQGTYSFSNHPELRSDIEAFVKEFSQGCADFLIEEIVCNAGKKANEPTSVAEAQCQDFSRTIGEIASSLGVLGPNSVGSGWLASMDSNPDDVRVKVTFAIASE